jgi:hypothetical protein
MFRRRKSSHSPEQITEAPFSVDELVTMTTDGLASYFKTQKEQELPATPHEGQLEVAARGKNLAINLRHLVDDFDESSILVEVGKGLARRDMNVDIGLVVKARNHVGGVTEIGVVVTPEGVEPPYERKVVYPPNPEDQLPSEAYNRLRPSQELPLYQLFIGSDAASVARRDSLGF